MLICFEREGLYVRDDILFAMLCLVPNNINNLAQRVYRFTVYYFTVNRYTR